jgi:phosphoglucomutase
MIDVLTGFKYIADQIKHYEETNEHTFMFGFEESYGYLVRPFVRDKDAIQGIVLLAEIAAYYRSKGQTLYDGVQNLFTTYGYHEEKTISKDFPGVDGKAKMAAIMEKVREERPDHFDDVAVVETQDFLSQTKYADNGETSPIELPKADVLKFKLADGSWIAIRPSGTEPKIKFYIGAVGESEEATLKKIENYEKAIDGLIN